MKISTFLMTFCILLPTALAQITFDQIQPFYSPGPVTLGFTVTNTLDQEANISVSAYVFPEGNPPYLDTTPHYWNDLLSSGESKSYQIQYTISEIDEAGTHVVAAAVEGDITATAEETFEVVGTLIPLSINLMACSGSCDSYTTAFLLSESPLTIEVLHSEGATLTGTVTTPSGGTFALDFIQDKATLSIDEEGKYTITVEAKLLGYADDEDTIEITTMEELPEVIVDTPCNANDVCDGAETRQNCPMDCLPREEGPDVGRVPGATGSEDKDEDEDTEKTEGGIDWIMVLIIIFTLAILFVIFDSRRNK